MTWEQAAAVTAVLTGIGVFWWWLTNLAIASALRAKTVQDEFEKRELRTKLDFLRIEKYMSQKFEYLSNRMYLLEKKVSRLLQLPDE